jgi:hypothetical protein
MTQKQSHFLFSSDFGHIANFGQQKTYVTIPPVYLPAGRSVEVGSVDVPLSVPVGSIPRTIIEFQGTTMDHPSYVATNGAFQVEEMYDGVFLWQIFWHRQNNSSVRFEYTVRRYIDDQNYTTPALTFAVIQQYLKPPDF